MAASERPITDTPAKTTDPVCGMEVEPGISKLVSVHEGHSYWFCAQGCRRAFEANPDKYLKSASGKKKGWLRRYLDRMAKVNKEQFGSDGPSCCH
jgi:YHS domain-containing protein